MSGLDRIIEKINADSDEQCRATIAQAEKQAREIAEEAEKRGNKLAEETAAAAQRRAQSILAMSEANVRQIERKAELAAKVRAIDEAVDAAYDALCSLPADEYFDALSRLAVSNAGSGRGVMRLSKADLARVPSGFADKINAQLKDGSVELSQEAANIENGFILVYGDIEINCTFKALISAQRDAIREKVCSVIF